MKSVIIIDDMFYDIDLIRYYTDTIYVVDDDYKIIEKKPETIPSVTYLSHSDICAKVIKNIVKM